MTDAAGDMLEQILRQCQSSAPQPWYPKHYAETAGVPRDSLDAPLERLRMAGLIRLTDWVQGNGQGYALTPDGARALESPRELARLRDGRLPPRRDAIQTAPRPRGETAYERGEAIRNALIDPISPYVTKALLAANILVFVAGLALATQRGVPANLYLWGRGPGAAQIQHMTGAALTSDLTSGNWWEWGRLLSCCFVHGGLLHLGLNMYGLYVLGRVTESLWGHARFLVLYLLAGWGGAAFTFLYARGQLTMLLGASGSLCGLLGGLVVWLVLNRRYLPRELLASWTRSMIINIVLIVFISFMPGVSGTAHFGGAAVGAVVAALLQLQRYSIAPVRWLALLVIAAVPVLCVVPLVRAVHYDERWQGLAGRQQEQNEQEEMRDFERDFLQRISRAARSSDKLYNEVVQPLLGLHATRRDPAAVAQAEQALARQQKELAGLVEELGQAGPYKSAQVEEARQVGRDYLAAQVKLLELAQDCLNQGEQWPLAKDDEIREQEQQVQQFRRKWRSLLA